MTSSNTAGKATVRAAPNIAFIKYWGARDLARTIPANPSISMTLEVCHSRSTVEYLPASGPDEVLWRPEGSADGELTPAPPAFAERVRDHLARLRRWAGVDGSFRLATSNSFPAAAGIASSASGFAALTLATVAALGRRLSLAELSDLARRSGSGSASRSVLGGYVEWPTTEDAARAIDEPEAPLPATALAPASHWQLCDVIALVESGAKETSSLDGHRRATSSPYWPARQSALGRRLETVRTAIAGRDLELLGRVVEEDAIDLHCVAMSSTPPIFYWRPGTLAVLEEVRRLRRDGCSAWATMDAGANVHVLCQPEDEARVAEQLAALAAVEGVIRDRVGDGPVYEERHLF